MCLKKFLKLAMFLSLSVQEDTVSAAKDTRWLRVIN